MFGRRYKTLGLKKKAWLLTAWQAGWASHSHLSSFLPQPKLMAGDVEGSPGGCCTHGGFVSQLRNLEFRQSHLLKEVARNLLNLCRMGDIFIILLRKTSSLCPSGHVRHRMFPGCLLYKHPWKDSPWQKLTRDREMLWKAVSQKIEESGMTLALHPSRNKTKILLYNTVRIAIIGIGVGSDWNLKEKTSTTG